MYAPIRVLEHETGPICSLCLVLFFGRFFFWLEENQPGVPAVTPKKQGERAVSKLFTFSPKLRRKKKHRHVDHSSETQAVALKKLQVKH